MRYYNIPIFLPELACPYRCVYCNQFSITGKQHFVDSEDVKHIIDRHLSTFVEDERFVEVAFFGGNFTGLPESMQDKYLEAVQPYLDAGLVDGLRCSTRPDYISSQRVRTLKRYGMLNIELGAQTTDDEVLRLCGRGHTFKDIEEASAMILAENVTLGLQMMLGLPGDTFEKDMNTASDIVRLGVSETRIYPCVVVKDTVLEQMYLDGRYVPLTLQEAVGQTATLLSYFDDNSVKVLRMGLHASEELDGAALVAGPYHHNFAEMVHGELWARRLNNIKEDTEHLIIKVPSAQLNHAIGWKAANKEMLQQRYKKVVFKTDDTLQNDSFVVNKKPDVIIIADARMPVEARRKLKTMGEVLWMKGGKEAYKSISGHPDIFFFCKDERNCKTVIYAPDAPSHIVQTLDKFKVSLKKGDKPVGKKYPYTALYNAVGIGDTLIHNTRYSDASLLTFGREICVNQGYTRCNLLALNDKAFITSDKGIQKKLEEYGCDVLYIAPEQIRLEGHDHGFFPGCCGLTGNKVVVCGSTRNIPEKESLDAFLQKYGMIMMELYEGELIDVGSIFFIS